MIFPEAELLLGTRKTSFGVQCAFCMQIKGSIFSPVFLFKLPLDFHFHFMLCPYLFFKKTSFTNKVLLSLPWHKESFLVPKAGKEISWQYSTYKLNILMMQNVHVLIEIKIEVTEVNSWSPEIIVPGNSGASVDPRLAASLISNTNLFTCALILLISSLGFCSFCSIIPSLKYGLWLLMYSGRYLYS